MSDFPSTRRKQDREPYQGSRWRINSIDGPIEVEVVTAWPLRLRQTGGTAELHPTGRLRMDELLTSPNVERLDA